jgi:hypothetical protein
VVLAGQGGWLMMSTCCPITRSAAGQCCSRALGLGLAGALLAELAVTGAIRVAGDGCLVTARIRLADGLARAVQLRMLGERDRHSTGDWLAYLAQSAEANVAGRLAGAGYLVRVQPRRSRRGAARWVPADPDCAFAPVIRMRAALDPARPPTSEATALAGLAMACGLGPRLMAYGPPGARQVLDGRIRQLGDRPRRTPPPRQRPATAA